LVEVCTTRTAVTVMEAEETFCPAALLSCIFTGMVLPLLKALV
jgi:hypothetical protein